MTANPPAMSPYRVAYPVAISLLLPVVSTIQPNLFEIVISTLPRIRACTFSSASPSAVPSNIGASISSKAACAGSIGTVCVRISSRSGQGLGIGDAVVARIPRGHEHARHVLGAERVHRDRRDERRVDAAREADQHVGEPVLRHVVAGAEHERLVDLVDAAEAPARCGARPGRRRSERPTRRSRRAGRHVRDRADRAAASGTSVARRGPRRGDPRRTASRARRGAPARRRRRTRRRTRARPVRRRGSRRRSAPTRRPRESRASSRALANAARSRATRSGSRRARRRPPPPRGSDRWDSTRPRRSRRRP